MTMRCGALIHALVLVPLGSAAVPASDFAGASACSKCHPAQFAAQSASTHSRALAPARSPQPGDWAFGAGVQAITFVKRLNAEYYMELGETWYRSLGGFARTPDHINTAGVRDRIFDPSAAILRCFACHSTGPLRVAQEGVIVPHELGVRCEACHGPAAAHARDPDRFRPKNPARFSADELSRLCGDCHRMPTAGGKTPDLYLRDRWNVRNQPLMLESSACFRAGGGRLSCLTCHSPHAPLDRRLSAYDQACSRCHATPEHKASISGTPCAECHMPSVTAQPHLVFVNHRIGVYSPENPMLPVEPLR